MAPPSWQVGGIFDDASEEKRPTVQVGDPFTEKLPSVEACLGIDVHRRHHRHPGHGRGGADLILGRDMGDKGGSGIELDLDRVPQRAKPI